MDDATAAALRDYFRANVCPRHRLADELVEVWASVVADVAGHETPAALSGDTLTVAGVAAVDLAALAANLRACSVASAETLVRAEVKSALLRAGLRRFVTWRPDAAVGAPAQPPQGFGPCVVCPTGRTAEEGDRLCPACVRDVVVANSHQMKCPCGACAVFGAALTASGLHQATAFPEVRREIDTVHPPEPLGVYLARRDGAKGGRG